MKPLDRRLQQLRDAGRMSLARGRSVGAVAMEKAAAAPNKVAVVEGDRQVTRGELVDMACRLGGALLSRGVEPGAVIAFQLPNWWEACVINLAAALFGYRLVPLLTIYRSAELGTILPACGVEALFVPQQYRGKDFPALIASLPEPPRRVLTLRGGAPGPDSFETLLAHAPAEPLLPPGDDAKMILFTSGSTGHPKGVLHSHASIEAIIRMAGEFWRIGPDDRLYIPSPIAHIGGSIYAFEFPWITDCTAVLAEIWDADRAVSDIEVGGCTFMAGATPFLQGLIDASERAGTSLPSLRRFICGGASVPPELVRRGLARFPNAVVSRAYGSSEVPLVCPGIRNRAEAEVRAETDGECEAELRIIGPDGEQVPDGEPGEIAVKAARMFLGYLDPRDDEGVFLDDGFFMMGDLGRRIDGKYLQITGRTKDIIIRKGENISPLEIENALARHDAVRQAAVIGVPDAERGEMVVAFVIPSEGRGFAFADMAAHLDRLGLAKQKFPERLEVVTSFPVNAVGKVQKNQLRERALSVSNSLGTTLK
ncbi:MAG: AMP-binding protein [Rhizobiaceae bacterium]|nr:AMP-binding protein [Rhizobiaceae bacterium]